MHKTWFRAKLRTADKHSKFIPHVNRPNEFYDLYDCTSRFKWNVNKSDVMNYELRVRACLGIEHVCQWKLLHCIDTKRFKIKYI